VWSTSEDLWRAGSTPCVDTPIENCVLGGAAISDDDGVTSSVYSQHSEPVGKFRDDDDDSFVDIPQPLPAPSIANEGAGPNIVPELGWEFQFLVPISGTPIGSRIPIPFLIPKIPVRIFFLNSAVEKSRNRNSDSKIRNSKKINVGIQYTSSCMRCQS
jgi:hypothetical protein